MTQKRAYQDQLKRLALDLNQATSILFITGAGISAESGLPTYRGIGGLYNDQLTDHEMPIEEALSGHMMEMRPDITWRYLSEIERACRGARHNQAHQIIADMEQHFSRILVLTQNVDGFHRSAGSTDIIDIHGDLARLYCTSCGFDIEDVAYEQIEIPPRCERCQAIMRPDVVLFGEYLDAAKIGRLQAELANGFDAVFSVGTTSVFPYISAPVVEAMRRGIPTVEINPGVTDLSELVSYKFSEGAVRVLSDLWEAVARNI